MKTTRRKFLRSSGILLALPGLETFGATAASPARRMVAINIPLGFLSEHFFPTAAGPDYELSSYLKVAEPIRNEFTVISGTSHPGVDGGHSAEASFLTCAPHPGSRGFKNSLSLDQHVAEKIGDATRFASLTLGDKSLSSSANGVSIPEERSPARLFEKLFVSGSPKEQSARKEELSDGQSILDTVLEEANSMQSKVSRLDREKLDQYFTAVREAELRLTKADQWLDTPKPIVSEENPGDVDGKDPVARLSAFFDVIRLALQTDSSRVVALSGANNSLVAPLPGVSMGYHALSHHGKNPEMMKQLEVIDRATIAAWVKFISSLKETADGESSLLDHTQVMLGSNLGNASGHITTNLPVLFAGGSHRHGQHLAFDSKNNTPLANLFVSMMQDMGLEEGEFGSGKTTLTGL